MPIDYKEYPANWKTEIRPAVMARAGEVRVGNLIAQHARCEECGVLNHEKGARALSGRWVTEKEINGLNSDAGFFLFGDKKFPNVHKIVLTVAHLDHDKSNENVSIDRLRAWCQRCHLNYDRPRHIANRKKNLEKKKGLINMFEDGE